MEAINFLKKKREKDWKLEREFLRELSIANLRSSVEKTFHTEGPIYIMGSFKPLIDTAFDCALEAYLLGATNSNQFSYSIDEISKRPPEQLEVTTTILKQYIQYYFAKNRLPMVEEIFIQSEDLIHFWWLEGYKTGKKRKKLRF